MNHNDKELTTFVDTVKCLLERKIATIIHERYSAQEDLKKIYDMNTTEERTMDGEKKLLEHGRLPEPDRLDETLREPVAAGARRTGEREDRRKGERRSGRERRSEANTPRSEMLPQRRDWSKPADRRSGRDRRKPPKTEKPFTPRDLAEWLVAMDEPGSSTRRTITLTKIIEAARESLAPVQDTGEREALTERFADMLDEWERTKQMLGINERAERLARVALAQHPHQDVERLREALTEIAKRIEGKQQRGDMTAAEKSLWQVARIALSNQEPGDAIGGSE